MAMSESGQLRIALAQFDFPVGDIQGNLDRARDMTAAAQRAGADLVLFPEMTLSGYPPEDLLLRPGFLESVHRALERFAGSVHGIDAIIGHPWAEKGERYNAVSWIRDGRVIGRYAKQHLPNYLVFDEERYFSEGGEPLVVDIRIGVAEVESPMQAENREADEQFAAERAKLEADPNVQALKDMFGAELNPDSIKLNNPSQE